MKYRIIVDKQPSTNPSNDKKTYEIDIEELRAKGTVHDSLMITKDEAYVIRRLSLSELHVLSVLENEVVERLEDLNITLFEGDNYIYLIDMTGNKFYAEYIVKNDFTEIYATRNEMNTAITQTANAIELSVNQKLEGYSTTQEMNTAINLKAGEITNSVSSTYATKDALNTAKTEIKQTTDSISNTVSSKVGNDEVVAKFNLAVRNNQGIVELKGNKVIIEADNFKLTEQGNITATGGSVGGFTLGATKFSGALNGIYDYNEFDFRATSCYLTGLVEYDSTLREICDAYSDGTVDAIDLLKIKKILLGQETNTKNMTGTFEINTKNPKDCISVKRNGQIAVSIGLGGVNANLVTANSILCGDVSGNNWSGVAINKNGHIDCVSLTQTSLESEKKNFEKLENALEIIKNIDIYKYNLKGEDYGTKKHIGFVIGDNYKYSEEVTSAKNTGVDTYSFISLCCKAIQEQQEVIQSQQEKIENLEKRLEALENGKN